MSKSEPNPSRTERYAREQFGERWRDPKVYVEGVGWRLVDDLTPDEARIVAASEHRSRAATERAEQEERDREAVVSEHVVDEEQS